MQNNSKQAVVPKKAINDSAGHDVFTDEQKVLEPGSCNVVSLGVNTEISKGFFWKIYPHSGQLINHFVGCDGSIIDFGYQGIVKVIMVNHSKVPFQVCIGQRIAQIIFHKIENYFSKSWCIVKFRKTIWRFWFYSILILFFFSISKNVFCRSWWIKIIVLWML